MTSEYSEQPVPGEDESLRYVLEDLDKEDQADLDRLKGMLAGWRSEPDIFRELGLDHREDFHSNLLGWLLTPPGSHQLGGHFLRNFLVRCGAGSSGITAENRRSTTVTREQHVEQDGGRGRLDIRILNNDAGFLCVIENKAWSGEGENQLRFYRETLDQEYRGYRIHRVFLTREGEPPGGRAEREHWTRMSYKDILELVEQTLNEEREWPDQDVMAFLRQYAVTLRRNIVPDVSNDVHQLARRIYRRHREAIDLIIEHHNFTIPATLPKRPSNCGRPSKPSRKPGAEAGRTVATSGSFPPPGRTTNPSGCPDGPIICRCSSPTSPRVRHTSSCFSPKAGMNPSGGRYSTRSNRAGNRSNARRPTTRRGGLLSTHSGIY